MAPIAVRPVFARADTGDQEQRRLLLVSYHFPPDTAIGARRWEKLAHFVAERGYGLDVIMRALPPAAKDQTRLDALPPGVRIFQVPRPSLAVERFEQWAARVAKSRRRGRVGTSSAPLAGSPARSDAAPASATPTVESIARDDLAWRLGHPRGWLRVYWAWLESARGRAWGDGVLRVARTLVREAPYRHVYQAVITSGPPHMIHDTGRRVAEATGLPFVMDMRDPWSLVERLEESVASPYWLATASRLERRAVTRAALVVANTDVARDALRALYPKRQGDIITVMNGADDDPLPATVHHDRFSIAHAGTIYLDRDPRPLFKAAAQVIRELELTPAQFGLDFIGAFTAAGGYPIQDVARQEGIEAFVTIGPALPHAQAMAFMAGATMLLTMSGGNVAAIPAKTFECVRFDAWLLALTAPRSATDRLLRGTGADVAAANDVEAIAAIIRRRYLQHLSGERPTAIGADDRFSRRRQATLLLDAVASRIGATPR